MVKLLKPGRIVIVLNGRMAGKKAVLVNSWEQGNKEKCFGFCLVVGVEKAPLKVNKKMSIKTVEKRCRVKPFVKFINFNHVLPTRYLVTSELDLKSLINESQMATPEQRKEAKKSIKAILQEKFLKSTNEKTGKASKDLMFLRKKLRF